MELRTQGVIRTALTLFSLSLQSCGPGVSQVEAEAIARNEGAGRPITTVDRAILLGQDLGAGYLELADRSARNQDVVSAGLIVITAGGALAAIDGAGSETLTAFAVAGLALNSGAQYFNLRGASVAFIDAAGRSLCISSAGRAIPLDANEDGLAVSILMDSYDRSKIILRRSLLRELPDYQSLVSQFEPVQGSGSFESALVTVDYDALKSNVGRCLAGG